MTEKTESINSILYQVQSHMRVAKNQTNNFGGYNYRTVDDILSRFKEIQEKFNVSITLNDEVILIGDRFYINSKATLIHSTGELTVSSQAREELSKKGMDAAQVTGAASTYARKRALEGLLALDSQGENDPDRTNKHEKEAQKTVTVKQPSPEEIKKQQEQDNRKKSAKYTFDELRGKCVDCSDVVELRAILSYDLKGSLENKTISHDEFNSLKEKITDKGKKLADL